MDIVAARFDLSWKVSYNWFGVIVHSRDTWKSKDLNGGADTVEMVELVVDYLSVSNLRLLEIYFNILFLRWFYIWEHVLYFEW